MLKQELVLHEAARKNNIAKVKELLARKVDVNAKNNVRDIFSMVKIMYVTLLNGRNIVCDHS